MNALTATWDEVVVLDAVEETLVRDDLATFHRHDMERM